MGTVFFCLHCYGMGTIDNGNHHNRSRGNCIIASYRSAAV